MKILFVMRSPQIFHYYETVYDALLKRGHNAELLFDKNWGENEYIANIKLGFSWAVSPRKNFRRRILLFFRELRSWRRYLITKNQSSFYTDRWLKYVSPKFRFLVKVFPFLKFFIKTEFFGAFLKNFEKNTKPDGAISADIKKRNPDIVLAGPVCYRQSSADLEYLKAATALRIPTAVPVMTWDTLTTKGIFHVIPDLLCIWNEAQIVEAMEHHQIPQKSVRIVGSPFFDKWFSDLKISNEKPKENYILYLGSSDNIAPDERWLIKEIRSALDNSEFKNVQIIFRPHPANFKIYQNFSIAGVTVSPKGGEMPKTPESFQNFYDMLCRSSAVVSINTSAMADAILAGAPVISLERKEFEKTQTLAQHYKHMRESSALYITKTQAEFLEIFSKLLSGNDPKKQERENFIKTFIRPRGLDKSAGEMVVIETEELYKRKNVQK